MRFLVLLYGGWVALGLIITVAVAIGVAWAGFLDVLRQDEGLLAWVLVAGAWVATLLVLQFTAGLLSTGVSFALYILYAAIGGLVALYTSVAYRDGTLVLVLALTTYAIVAIGAMRFSARRWPDLVGILLAIGMCCFVLAGLFRVFFEAFGLPSWLSILFFGEATWLTILGLALPPLLGLVVYHTWVANQLGRVAEKNGGGPAAPRVAITSRLGSYLAFLSFLFAVLRIVSPFLSN